VIRTAIEAAVAALTPLVGRRRACAAAGWPRATWYRRHQPGPTPGHPPRPRRPQPRALAATEQAAVLDVLHSERFADAAPATVYATLLDEGRYLASVPTMYRLLHAAGEVRERRRQATHPPRVKPELVATRPNEVWSWDIERHEALPHRAVVKGHRCRPVAAGR
jgi:putative transposase